ncbi:hypothetical protein JZ751_016748 [Albula glossodonta]|uniref:PDZ domain-containing protein n=1 Tax=Albula glossodonta TaxID=121402 RepID=A0A8T2NRP7_9TELE|nr:hypothetical protein JZ751_016748 [Albula glossodonta]
MKQRPGTGEWRAVVITELLGFGAEAEPQAVGFFISAGLSQLKPWPDTSTQTGGPLITPQCPGRQISIAECLLLFVNGKDLSKATPDEAVEAFCHARDPIVVQVLRRSPAPRSHGNSQEICLVDVCTQTDITFEHIMALSKLRPPTPPLPDICPFLLSDRYAIPAHHVPLSWTCLSPSSISIHP